MVYPAIAIAVLGLLWLWGQVKWGWIGSVGMLLAVIAAVAGIFLGLSVSPMTSAVMFAFIAWDLTDFHGRLKLAAEQDDVGNFERNHLTRLGLVLAAGWGAVLLTGNIRVRFTFEIAVLLVLVGIWGMSQLVGRLRRDE